MATVTLDTRLTLKNDIKANWDSNNTVLLKGELGIQTDTTPIVMKVGDGVTAWGQLQDMTSQAVVIPRIPTASDSGYNVGQIWVDVPDGVCFIFNGSDWLKLDQGDMKKSSFATNAKVDSGYVDKAILADSATTATTATGNAGSATKLQTARTITTSGDVIGTATPFDGQTNITIPTVLKDVVTSGSGTKIIYNSKGIVTGSTTLSASDIPTLPHTIISDFDTGVRTNTLNQMTAPTADLSINTHKLTNVIDPTNAQDAATKNYVDTSVSASRAGLNFKDPVRVATPTLIEGGSNIVLATGGLLTIDGVTVVDGDRILVKSQSTASENGIYIAHSGAWVRATDADSSTKVKSGMIMCVNEGTLNKDSQWVLMTDGTITLGTTNLVFTKFTSLSDLVASTGLTKTGNTLSIDSTVATLTGTQTLTNKALSNCTINGTVTALSSPPASDNSLALATTEFTKTVIGNITSVTGNAGTATKLATARTIALTGEVVATGVPFDGSGNISLSATIPSVNVNKLFIASGDTLILNGGNA